jgi:hypothetical protein
VPPATHGALKWTSKDPLSILPVVTDSPWQIIKSDGADKIVSEKKSKNNAKSISSFIPAQGSIALSSKKRKLDAENPENSSKKSRTVYHSDASSPAGLIWDGDNYSCAYDALYVILYEIWSTDHKLWSQRFKKINKRFMKPLASGFKKYMENKASFEDARDHVRSQLHARYRAKFPYGTIGTSVSALTYEMFFSDESVAFSCVQCSSCGYKGEPVADRLGFMIDTVRDTKSTSSHLGSLQHENNNQCPDCSNGLEQPIFFKETPNILAFGIAHPDIKVSSKIKYVNGDQRTVLKLRGLIYFGDIHFTSRIISDDGTI